MIIIIIILIMIIIVMIVIIKIIIVIIIATVIIIAKIIIIDRKKWKYCSYWELLFDSSIRDCNGLKENEWLLFEESPLLLQMESVTKVAFIVVGTIPVTCIGSGLKYNKNYV